MPHNEGIATKNGENLNIQCLLMSLLKHRDDTEKTYHYHQYMELIYVLSGSITAYIDDKSYRIPENSLLMVFPNEPHTYSSDTDNRYIVIKFFTDILHTREQSVNEFEYIFNLSAHNNRHTRVIRGTDEIRNLLVDSYDKFAESQYTSELYIRSNIIRVCAHILDFWKEKGEIIPIKHTVTADNIAIIKKLTEQIRENSTVKTHQAAKMCGMSDGHFSRIFKSVTGATFTQYIKSVKIDRAERLLKCSDMSVTEIAQSLEYATTSHFIEDFRKEKGISPKQYRKYAFEKIEIPNKN